MTEKHKIALFYYSQTGQALTIAEKVCEPLVRSGCEIVYKEIAPETPYPFPWNAITFFQVFPESRLGVTCRLKPIDLSSVEDADLVIIAGQSWYLSWSVPLHSFFLSDVIQNYLKGRNIVVINGCRNMWVMTQQLTRKYIREAGGNYAGFISLQDKTANLISVITIIRWLFYNRKEATRLLPAAGVSVADIEHSTIFGEIIREALEQNNFVDLQDKLMKANAVTFLPSVYFTEINGYRLWGRWAKFILKKGPYGDPKRKLWLQFFCVYLFSVLYAVSPFGMLFFYLTCPFRKASLKKAKHENCYNLK
jgi:hypothetical protein